LHSNMYFSQVSSWWQNDFWHHASGALDGMHHGKALRLLLRHRDSFAWAACSLLRVICPTQGRKSALFPMERDRLWRQGGSSRICDLLPPRWSSAVWAWVPECPQLVPSLFLLPTGPQMDIVWFSNFLGSETEIQ
jgi:hypothetical protein